MVLKMKTRLCKKIVLTNIGCRRKFLIYSKYRLYAQQRNSIFTVRNSEVIQCGFESILSCKAHIKKIAVLLIPLREPSIVERLHIISNYERDNVMGKAFFKHNQPADASIAVLEWNNPEK